MLDGLPHQNAPPLGRHHSTAPCQPSCLAQNLCQKPYPQLLSLPQPASPSPRLKRSTDPLGRSRTTVYDEAGNVLALVDAKGQPTTATYNARNERTGRLFADNLRHTFVYDAVGNRTQMQETLGRSTFTYDPLNQLRTANRPNHPNGHPYTYGYDRLGNLTSLSTPLGITSTTYDTLNRLSRLVNPFNETTTFTYDALDRETRRQLANGVSVSTTFDALGRPTVRTHRTASGTLLARFTQTYDALGNRLSQVELDGTRTTNTYDVLDRLSSERRSSGSGTPGAGEYWVTYTYDASGNRRTRQAWGTYPASAYGMALSEYGGVTTFLNDRADQLLYIQSFTGLLHTLTYDKNGSLLSERAGDLRVTYTWDVRERLSSITFPSGVVQSNVYDAFSLRVQRSRLAPTTATADDAVFVAQAVPKRLSAGQTYPVWIALRNSGTNPWPAGSTYQLGSQNPQDNTNWGLSRVALASEVQPGEEVVFAFSITAPSTAGDYAFRWQMVTGSTWFGEMTPDLTVTVASIPGTGNSSRFLSQSLPRFLQPGQRFPISISFQNNGTSNWSSTGVSRVRLGSQNPTDNTNWGFGRVELAGDVASSSSITLSFTLTAPSTPGSYACSWRLLQEGVGEFGDTSADTTIVVQPLDTSTPDGIVNYLWEGGHVLAERDRNGALITQYTTSPEVAARVLGDALSGLAGGSGYGGGVPRAGIGAPASGLSPTADIEALSSGLAPAWGLGGEEGGSGGVNWGSVISQRTGNASRFPGFDTPGSTRFLTDSSAGITDRYGYQAFGEEWGAEGSSANSSRYMGQYGYWRDSTLQEYVLARYLNPTTGRWLSVDPVEGQLRYAYALGNPYRYLDPSGLGIWESFGAAAEAGFIEFARFLGVPRETSQRVLNFIKQLGRDAVDAVRRIRTMLGDWTNALTAGFKNFAQTMTARLKRLVPAGDGESITRYILGILVGVGDQLLDVLGNAIMSALAALIPGVSILLIAKSIFDLLYALFQGKLNLETLMQMLVPGFLQTINSIPPALTSFDRGRTLAHLIVQVVSAVISLIRGGRQAAGLFSHRKEIIGSARAMGENASKTASDFLKDPVATVQVEVKKAKTRRNNKSKETPTPPGHNIINSRSIRQAGPKEQEELIKIRKLLVGRKNDPEKTLANPPNVATFKVKAGETVLDSGALVSGGQRKGEYLNARAQSQIDDLKRKGELHPTFQLINLEDFKHPDKFYAKGGAGAQGIYHTEWKVMEFQRQQGRLAHYEREMRAGRIPNPPGITIEIPTFLDPCHKCLAFQGWFENEVKEGRIYDGFHVVYVLIDPEERKKHL